METHHPANANTDATTSTAVETTPTLDQLQHLQSQDARVTRLVVECVLLLTPEAQNRLPSETVEQIKDYVDRHVFQICAELPHEIIKLDMVPTLGHWDGKRLSMDLLLERGEATLSVPMVFTPDVDPDVLERVGQFLASPTGSDQPSADQA